MRKPSETHATILWLLPAEAERRVLHNLIARLAQECDAPVFEPHLTLGRGTPAQLESIRSHPLHLRVAKIDQTAQFTKTLFVRLEKSDALGALRCSATGELEASYDPHVSLLYRKLPEGRRVELAREVLLPFAAISFDAVALVRAPDPTETRADVEAWEKLGVRKLSWVT